MLFKTQRCLALCIALAFLCSCLPQNQDIPKASQNIITFGAPESDENLYTSAINSFNEQNPDLQVQFVKLPHADGTPREVLQRIAASADTAVTDGLIDVADSGLTYDLTPLMNGDASFNQSDFYPETLNMFRQGDKLFLIPYELQPTMLYYNKDLWEAQGLPTPNPSWQWKDFIGAASMLAKKEGNTIQRYGFWDDFLVDPLIAELAAQGMQPLTTPAAAQDLTSPVFAKALQQVQRMVDEGAIVFDLPNIDQMISDQKIGIWPTNMDINISPSFRIGVIRLPPIPQSPYAQTQDMRGYLMSRGTHDPAAAWRWLSFLSRQPLQIQQLGTAESFPVPVRRSIAQQLKTWESMEPETRSAMESAMESPAPTVPNAAYDVDIILALSDIIQGVITEHKPIDQVLQAEQAALSQKLASRTPVPTAAPPIVDTPIPQSDPNTKTIIFGGWPATTDAARNLVNIFNKQHPGEAVRLGSLSVDPRDLHAMAAQFDCFIGWTSPEPHNTGDLADLQSLASADLKQIQPDYPTALLAAYQIDGGTYGLPYLTFLRSLGYNHALLAQEGVPDLTSDWSADDFLMYAQQMRKDHGKERSYGFAGNRPNDVFFFLDRFQAEPVRFTDSAITLRFTDAQVERALAYYIQLLKSASPHTSLQGYRGGDAEDPMAALIASGQIGMWLDSAGGPANAPSDTRHIAALFGGKHAGRHDVYSMGLYISQRTPMASVCWEWISFLSQQQVEWSGIGFPARRSVAPSATLGGSYDENKAINQAYQAALDAPGQPVVDNDPLVGGTVNYYWFYQAIDHALQGQDLHKELQQAQQTTQSYISCVQAGDSGQTCARQADPAYQGR